MGSLAVRRLSATSRRLLRPTSLRSYECTVDRLITANAKYTATASAYAVAPAPPSRSGLLVVGQAGGEGVALHPLARFLTRSEKVVKRHELAGGEKVAPVVHPV